MTSETTKENQEKLNKLIFSISKEFLDGDKIRANALILKDIYSGDFRHLYSEIFPVITEIINSDEYNKECLLTNLDLIKLYVESDFNKTEREFSEETLKRIRKLCDHVNLEAARLNYSIKTNEEMNETKELLSKTRSELVSSQDSVKEATEKLKESQGQIIAVLSIFAAIVLTFAGGIGLFGSAISSVAEAPILNLLLIVFATGLILIDAVAALMYVVSRIVGKSIFAQCIHKTCDCKKDDGKPLCNVINKIRHKLPFIFWLNVVLLILIVVTFVLLILNHYYSFI